MKLKNQKGFTLIELMVVIVIIGILAAVAIPKMFGMSAKAKASEVAPATAGWERTQSAYVIETNGVGSFADIGFTMPTSNNFVYTSTETGSTSVFTATNSVKLNECAASGGTWTSTINSTTISSNATRASSGTNCVSLTPSYAL